uniref:NYN domain-containing protein n=1 Tax=Heligmosomoides polygyrus TaxID=6339 RepID=A0A183GVE8_HELPZ
LGLFSVCPGEGRRVDDPEDYCCSIRSKTFADVVLDERDPVIRSLLVHSMSGVQKAYSFYKGHCDHLLRALILHDGMPIAMVYKENVNIDIAQLNDLANAGIRCAQTHSWDDMKVEGPVRKILLILAAFRGFGRVIRPLDNVSAIIYNSGFDVVQAAKTAGAVKTCIIVRPMAEEPVEASNWQCFAMAMTNLVRNGTKLIGEELYQILDQSQIRTFAYSLKKKMSSTRS